MKCSENYVQKDVLALNALRGWEREVAWSWARANLHAQRARAALVETNKALCHIAPQCLRFI